VLDGGFEDGGDHFEPQSWLRLPPGRMLTAKFLQRGQIVQLGRSVPLFLDAHTKRAFEATSRVDHFLGKLAPDNPLLRRVPAFEDCGTLTAASASTGAINLLGGKMGGSEPSVCRRVRGGT
jgi:hypothetical protein